MRVLIVQDYKENRRKCSLTPLEGREGFTFLRLRNPSRSPSEVEIPGGVLLHIGGPTLALSDSELVIEGHLVVVDSTWARVPRVLDRLKVERGGRLERRSLPAGFVTAYPRKSKLYNDPSSGLASVEALFVALFLLGDPQPDLLRHYRWAGEFLSHNLHMFRTLCPNHEPSWCFRRE